MVRFLLEHGASVTAVTKVTVSQHHHCRRCHCHIICTWQSGTGITHYQSEVESGRMLLSQWSFVLIWGPIYKKILGRS